MPAHMRPAASKARPLGVLALALGAGALVLGAFDGESDHPITRFVRPASVSTEPTVLGEAIEQTTTVPDAPPASPATFTLTSPDVGAGGAPSTTLQGGTTGPTLGPPVSITSPDPPRTTTSTRPGTTTSTTLGTTTTTDATTTTTEEPTTTTEAPPIDE